MLDRCQEIAKRNKECAFVLDEMDDSLSRFLEGVEARDKVSKLLPEIVKHVPKSLALDLIEIVDRTFVDEIESTYKLEGFNEWYEETHGVPVENA